MLDFIQYNQDYFFGISNEAVSDVFKEIEAKTQSDKYANIVNWIDVPVKEAGIIQDLAKYFNWHELVIEDIDNHHHLPKYEQYEHYSFLTLKMLSIGKNEIGHKTIEAEQVAILLGKGWIVTIQEDIEGDIFDTIRHKLQNKIGKLRFRTTDYLFYRLLDTIVDAYFEVLEHLHDEIENLEAQLLGNPDETQNQKILFLKKELRVLRRYMLPLKSELAKIKIETPDYISKHTLTYLSDVYDHLVSLENHFQSYTDMLNDLTDLHLSYLSHSMNKVMKTLSTVSTIFIPLTFIVGVYGMNFDFMPELHYTYAYPILMFIMCLIAIVLVIFMRRKGWF